MHAQSHQRADTITSPLAIFTAIPTRPSLQLVAAKMTKVYVGGLLSSATKDDLEDFFKGVNFYLPALPIPCALSVMGPIYSRKSHKNSLYMILLCIGQGAIGNIWIARQPPGFGFVEFKGTAFALPLRPEAPLLPLFYPCVTSRCATNEIENIQLSVSCT
jgi:hypothetical protein